MDLSGFFITSEISRPRVKFGVKRILLIDESKIKLFKQLNFYSHLLLVLFLLRTWSRRCCRRWLLFLLACLCLGLRFLDNFVEFFRTLEHRRRRCYRWNRFWKRNNRFNKLKKNVDLVKQVEKEEVWR